MTEPQKLDLKSMDIAAEKREELKRCLGDAFPEAFAEGRIDFDQLKRALGEWVEPGKERFGLTWPGKAECMKIIQQPSFATLKPLREESVNFDETENVFIEGDNLEVLKLIQKAYFGKIKVIYIDPPYNTGNEFIYPDKYAETLDTYLAYTGQVDDQGMKFSTNADRIGRFHSRWLSMIYPRLYLARNLLKDDGLLFASIDNNELFNLKHVCDLVFGEENFISCIANISNPKGRSDDKYVATSHDYILIYKKNETTLNGWEPGEHITKRYNKLDEKGEKYREIDLRKTGDQDRREDRPNMFYPFYYNENTKELLIGAQGRALNDLIEILPRREDGVDGRWRWGIETAKSNVDQLIARYMPNRGQWSVFEKDYLSGRDGVKPTSSWTFKDVNSERGSEQLIELGFAKEVFPNPKPVGTLQRLIQLGTSPQGEDIILDFFAGSATTAQAVYQQNAEDGGTRKFILVQLPEIIGETDAAHRAGFKTISEIGKERIRRAAKSIQSLVDSQLALDGHRSTDFGMKVFGLARSNFRVWDGATADADALDQQLEMHIDHLSGASSPSDILYELLLKSGFPLTTKVQAVQMAGKQVFSVDGGGLLICLEKEITAELIDALAEANPIQVICLDEGFKGNDQLKANAVQTFKARAASQESEIVFRTV